MTVYRLDDVAGMCTISLSVKQKILSPRNFNSGIISLITQETSGRGGAIFQRTHFVNLYKCVQWISLKIFNFHNA